MKRFYLYFISMLLFLGLFCSPAQSSNLVYSDDFESGYGNWSNVTTGDNKNWTHDSGGTPSSNTGPSTGADGSTYYVYLETSSGSAYTAHDAAILLGPTISGTNISLTFQYHMYGANMGTLAVDVLEGDTWIKDVWTITGQQHISNSVAYTAVDVDLSAYTVSQIRFRARAAGGYTGDMAIDNVEIWGIPTGPVAPVFNSDPVVKPLAIQDQPYSDSLANDAIDPNGDSMSFSKISGPAWLNVAANGELRGTPEYSDVGLNSFIVEVSDGILTSTATIEITVNDNITPIILFSDDFESGLGNWSNVSSGDNYDWTRNYGGTTSSGTGPSNGADGSSYYMYLETSSGYAYISGDTAILQGPSITGTNIHIAFQYHMYGSDIGVLAIDVLSGGSWINDVWSISGQQQSSNGDAYTSVDVDLSAYNVSQIRFHAIAAGGYTGDMAIDNVEISSVPAGPAPVFLNNPTTKSTAIIDIPYNDSLANDAVDPNGDLLYFSKISGPAWLYVDPDGTLSGTPSNSDTGTNVFIVSVSDAAFSSSATVNIYVGDGVFATTVFPYTAGHGVDGGANYGWVVDGIIDEYLERTVYQDHVVIQSYKSLDSTKRAVFWGAFEFKLPQNIINNAANVVVESAELRLDIEGSARGLVYFHGYSGDGIIQLSDFTHDNLIAEDNSTYQRITVDVTDYVNSLVGQSNYVGFLLKPYIYNTDTYVALWNGTHHPQFGPTSGEISSFVINYRIE